MSDETETAAWRYSRDMRRIREERDVSIQDIYEETRIAQTLIESFEDSSLYDHPSFNRIYLRSFIRVYAEAIDLPPDEALEALEAALDGTYQDELSARYLREGLTERDESPEVPSPPSAPPSDDETEERNSPTEAAPTDSSSGRSPPAGGIEGRGGIVGPARAAGESDDVSTEEEEANSDREGRPSPPSPDTGETRSDEEDVPPLQGGISEARPLNQESPSYAGEDESDDPSLTEDPDDRDAEPAYSSAEGPPEEPSDERFGVNSSVDPEGEEEASETPRREDEGEGPFSSSSSDREDDPDPQLAGGVSGIVGEPKELGSASKPPSTSTASDPSPIEGAETSNRSRTSGTEGVWKRRRQLLLSGVGIVVLIGVLVGLAFYYSTTPSPGEEANVSTAAEDTTQTVAVQDTATSPASTERRPPAALSLGDTLTVTVLAEAALSELRVQRDEDLRRPYWIEEGEAAVFPFTQRITFENDLGDAQFLLEQYPYPSQQDGQGRIVIDRPTVEAFADTLRGQPQPLSVTPDTIPIGNPVPEGGPE